jgi:hypothetical protein
MPDAKSAAKENPIHHFMMPSELVLYRKNCFKLFQ